MVAKDYLAALDSLAYVNKNVRGSRSLGRGFAKSADKLLRAMPDDPKLNALKAQVTRKLHAISR